MCIRDRIRRGPILSFTVRRDGDLCILTFTMFSEKLLSDLIENTSRHCEEPRRTGRAGAEPARVLEPSNEMAKKVAELFVEVLTAAGVERIYGVAGDSLNGITDSVRVREGIE